MARATAVALVIVIRYLIEPSDVDVDEERRNNCPQHGQEESRTERHAC